MSEQSKAVNAFFRLADMREVKDILDNIILTERQTTIFKMKYIKGNDINFIADTVGCCPRVINKELKQIRSKLARHLGL